MRNGACALKVSHVFLARFECLFYEQCVSYSLYRDLELKLQCATHS